MTIGQSTPALVVYWIPYVGIGHPIQKVVVPLTDILNYERADGSPQVTAAILAAATFTGSPDNFLPPYLDLGGLAAVLTPRTSDINGPVRQLQAHRIKVLLSIVGVADMGWDQVPAVQNAAFAQWVQSEVLDKYGLDGIDIDDEYCDLPGDPQRFVDTIAALRGAAPHALITKALWQDEGYFTQPVSTTSPWFPGAYLSQMLDLGSTMTYGTDAAGLEACVEAYTSILIGDQNVGLAPSQLCIGVQAGVGSWMTTLADSEAAAAWVAQQGYGGMMLYTFSQDIQQWTHQPQNSPGYMFPNPNDHEWQRGIIEAMGKGA
jgi:hypothetical protein